MNIPLIIPRETNKPRNVDILLMTIFRKTKKKKKKKETLHLGCFNLLRRTRFFVIQYSY